MIKDFDYQEFGGVPLLGINGVAVIGHGKTTPLAMKNIIFRAEEMVRKEVNKKIGSTILQKQIFNKLKKQNGKNTIVCG